MKLRVGLVLLISNFAFPVVAEPPAQMGTLTCDAMLLAHRHDGVISSDLELFLEGVIEGAKLAMGPGPQTVTRIIAACEADPTKSVAYAISQARNGND